MPGQFHRRLQNHENDALGQAVGNRPVINCAVGNCDIAGAIMTDRITKPTLQHEHRFKTFVRVRGKRRPGSATQKLASPRMSCAIRHCLIPGRNMRHASPLRWRLTYERSSNSFIWSIADIGLDHRS